MSAHGLLQTWRRFPFFDRERVKDPENPSEFFSGLQDINIVCCTTGNGFVFVGEADGGISQISRSWDINSFKAHKSALYQAIYVRQHNVLVTVGEDGPGINPFIKVWALEKIDKQGIPFCSRCSKASPSNRAVKENRPNMRKTPLDGGKFNLDILKISGQYPLKPVTALAVHSSLQFMAVGFEDSSVLLYRGDITKEKQSKSQLWRDGLTCAEDGAVVGLGFHTLPDKTLAFYVSTTHSLFTYVIGPKEKDVKPTCAYKEGSSSKCWSLADQELQHQFIVARREGIYFYQHNDKGGCQLFEGEKVLMKTFGGYLIVVFRDVNTPEADKEEKMNMLTVYDIPNVYIGYSAPIPQVVDIFHEWGSFFVITKNGRVYELIEKDTQAKLDILFRKNLYDLAVKLAESHQLDEQLLSNIYKQYGDFLYAKSDYANAVRQYIKTIGRLEPSYVIRKFLDSQRIEQMTEYLEALHKTDIANYDHTTILLNCYTKLSDSAKIEKFVNANDQDNYFDVDTALRVLRGSGYLDHALKLAKRHVRHDLYLQMLVEDKKDYVGAVHYIASLNFSLALEYALKYGKCLNNEAPDLMMNLVKELCTGFSSKDNASVQKAPADTVIDIFVTDSKRLLQFLEHMINIDNSLQAVTYHTLLELYLREYSKESSLELKIELHSKIMHFLKLYGQKYELDQALLLCQTNNFDAGILFLYERAEKPDQILQHYIQKKDFKGVVDTCQKYGYHRLDGSYKDMWIQALWFFSRTDETPSNHVEQLLRHIEDKKILPPLMVLEILSRSHTVTLGVVKDYLLNWLKTENQQITAYEERIAEYEKEIDRNRTIVRDIETNPQIFQISKCSACDTPLETPTVHFLCKHSYHQHCFESYAENESECPACLPENKKLRALIGAQSQAKDSYQQFRSDLSNAADTIAVVAEYFGRGAFSEKSDVSVQAAASIGAKTPRKSLNPFEE